MKRLFCFLFLVVSVAVGAQAPTKPYDFSRTDPVSSSKINQNFDLLYDWSAVASAAIDTKSDSGHLHDDRYYTESEADGRFSLLSHLHDDRYFTETESDGRFSLLSHLHDDRYYTETEVNSQALYYSAAAMTSHRNSFRSSDTRSSNYAPQDRDRGLYADFKANVTDGLSDGGIYHGSLTFRPYGLNSDMSGGCPFQLGFTENTNLWLRKGASGSSWGSWYKLWHSANDGSGSGLDADKLDGYHLSTTRNSANTVPVRDSSGYLNLGWINTTSGSAGTRAPDRIYGSYDSFLRYYTPANLATVMEPYLDDHFWQAGNDGSGSGLDADLLDGNHASSFVLRNLPRYSSPFTNANSPPRVFNPIGLSTTFIKSSYGWPVSYGQVLNIPSYLSSQDGAALQIVSPYAQSCTDGGRPIYRVGKYNNAGWTEWRTIADVETTAKQPCSFYIPGLYTASEVIARFVAPRTVTLPSGCSGSYANLETAHSSAITFGIYKNTTLVGTINFGASSTTATFTLSSTQTFSAGDTLVIKAPGSVTNAAGLTLSLMLTHDL